MAIKPTSHAAQIDESEVLSLKSVFALELVLEVSSLVAPE